jgi:protocatechuate 3,4-dioxygenase beta subunit
MKPNDDAPVGRVFFRREVLGLFATAAGAAAAARLPRRFAPGAGTMLAPLPAAAAALPSCIVRPAQTEGPYFVDEKLRRSDIRSDPSDGSTRDGVRLGLAFAVSRIDGGSCAPFEGVVVDIWHCDAAGIYSDVRDPAFDTAGRKFLRGYQVTDANGAASFVTVYPGWYQGRTVHVHFKLRTDPGADVALEFTSQLYFDDALTDVVHARQPYAARGPRTVRNDGDGIYRNGGSALLLTVVDDGSGGYLATFDVGIDAGGTTTTTLPAGGCATVAACLAAVEGALPDLASAAGRKARRTAHRLRTLVLRLAKVLHRAGTSTGARQTRYYAKVRAKLQALLAASRAADGRGTLAVPLAPLEDAITALLSELPA